MPILSAITISLVPEMRGGPFVYWDDLEAACIDAVAMGFDAVEVFPRSIEELNARQLRDLLDRHGLKLAAMGSGAGWVVQKLKLTDPDPAQRNRAREFVAGVIDLAGSFGAPAIVGSMQGRIEGGTDRQQALAWLGEAFEQLAPRAHALGVPLLFEPLNRYETNVLNRVKDSLDFLRGLKTQNVQLLCDLFHMNIEEQNIAGSLRLAGPKLGHVHFVDSNRLAAGLGHIDMAPIAAALSEMGYQGFVSGEVLPQPTSEQAAAQTIASFKKWFRS